MRQNEKVNKPVAHLSQVIRSEEIRLKSTDYIAKSVR
jgi:hypothetical protein